MAKVKELHLGKNIEDLVKHTQLPNVTSRKTLNLLESARTLRHEAERYNREGDEELAYVFYMKYFNMLSEIHKKNDYPQYKHTVRDMLGGNTANMETMDKLEILSKSLSNRYNRLNEPTPVKSPVPPKSPVDYYSLSASDKFDILKTGASPTMPSNEITLRSLRLIKCKDLFQLTRENNVLIMDCRPSADYKMSHLNYVSAFNVPEEIIQVGMSAGKLQNKLDESSRVLWAARSVKDYVVLVDWNTNDVHPPENTPISILMNILQNWDPDVVYRSPIKILENGYEYFIMMYPALCTNPSVQAPHKHTTDSDLIDDIEYPSIHDITMKDDIRQRDSLSPIGNKTESFPVQRPSVDRSSKLAAMKAYDSKQKPIVEIMKEQDELLEKAQANDEKLQQASKKLVTLVAHKDKSQEGATELVPNEQELLYNIMQLESAAEDYKIENNRLRDELEQYKRIERERQEQRSPNEVEDLEQTTKKIENKIHERQKVDEQHERLKLQREQQLAIAREKKRHMKPSMFDEDDISKPKIPQFDRSVKPQITPPPLEPSTIDRQRDFSPVPGGMGRGLTGLKNLGNTCYMNSILQCLSNTPQLTEYCITDEYKRYISRSNKTKGQIVEEVAALIKILWTGNYKCVASKDLRYVIGQYQQIFRGMAEQDSHEFLTILMDWLHSDLQTLLVPEKPRDNISASEKAWLEFTKAKESLILHLFYGQIKSTVKCVDCNKESATYECFSNLSLELPPRDNDVRLSKCMDMYFSGELVNGWNCPNCKDKRNAVKKLDISKLPPVLIIHLKRFYAGTGSSGKKKTYVRFPLENLDMTPYIAKSELRSVTPKTYQLYGVSNHYGSMESGHYTAFCKSGNNGRWYKFDDEMVSYLDTSNVESSAAYILFYTWLPPIQVNDAN